MKNLQYEEEICGLLGKYKKNYTGVFFAKTRKHLGEYIIEQTPVLDGFKFITRLYWVLNGLTDFPKCEICGKDIRRDIITLQQGYFNPPCKHLYCSSKCAQNSDSTHLMHDSTCVEKYGTRHFSNPEKAKTTCLKRYGVENVFQTDWAKEKSAMTKLERYGDMHYVNAEKRNATNIEKYGAANAFASEIVKSKIAETNISRYSVPNPMQSPDIVSRVKKTNLEKYGVEYPGQAGSPILAKIKDTNFKKYGNWYLVSDEYIESNMLKYGVPYPMMNSTVSANAHRKRKGKLFCNDIGFDSVPEMAFYIFHKIGFNHDIECHPNIYFEFEAAGKTRKYWPDFKLDGRLIEIKGKHFFKKDGTMYCPYRYTGTSDEKYAELCEIAKKKYECMVANSIEILTNDGYAPMIEYFKKRYPQQYRDLKYGRTKSITI